MKVFHFPGAVSQNERRQKWIKACHRADPFVCTKDSYICSLHFVGGNGPTEEDPDPISLLLLVKKGYVYLFCTSVCHLNQYFIVNESRLVNEWQTKPEARKICLERSVAKTLLTLNRHTGKSKEERDMTLLDLSSEPVASPGGPDEKSMQEFEPEERTDEF